MIKIIVGQIIIIETRIPLSNSSRMCSNLLINMGTAFKKEILVFILVLIIEIGANVVVIQHQILNNLQIQLKVL